MLAGGWDLDMLEATLRQAAPRVAYVIADHQNPTGLTMPAADARAARRAGPRLAHAAGDRRDDRRPASSTAATPPPPVAALDPDGETVITIGSMSKAFWAGLRIGWIRANPALIRRLAAARAALDIRSPVLEQLIAVELLADADDDPRAPARRRPRAPRRVRRRAARRRCPEWRFAAARRRAVALGRARRAAQHRARRDRRPLRPAARRRARASASTARSSASCACPSACPSPVLEDAAARLAVAWRAVSESGPMSVEPPTALVA